MSQSIAAGEGLTFCQVRIKSISLEKHRRSGLVPSDTMDPSLAEVGTVTLVLLGAKELALGYAFYSYSGAAAF